MSQFAVDLFGYPYDNDEIAKIATRIALGGLGVKFYKAIKPDREFICSEYVARCYEQIGVNVRWNSKGFVSPADYAADPDVNARYVLKN